MERPVTAVGAESVAFEANTNLGVRVIEDEEPATDNDLELRHRFGESIAPDRSKDASLERAVGLFHAGAIVEDPHKIARPRAPVAAESIDAGDQPGHRRQPPVEEPVDD